MNTEVTAAQPAKASLIITYGCGSNLENCYSRVTGETMTEVRDRISEVTKNKYSFSYPDDSAAEAMIARWNLKEVALQPMYPVGGHY